MTRPSSIVLGVLCLPVLVPAAVVVAGAVLVGWSLCCVMQGMMECGDAALAAIGRRRG